MSPETVERALAQFRDWFAESPRDSEPNGAINETVDFRTVVAQFTALRHEVNLQTKASRAATEQNAAILEKLGESLDELRDAAEAEPPPDTTVPPLLRILIEVYDSLALAERQIGKQKAAINTAIANLTGAVTIEFPPIVPREEAPPPGFWQRFFGPEAPPPPASDPVGEWHRKTTKGLAQRQEIVQSAGDYVRDALDALLTGYSMSLSRIDRALTKQGLETIRCAGKRFDPEFMEVVETVPNTGQPLGEVLEEVRRGYLLNGAVFRFAQVRVAR